MYVSLKHGDTIIINDAAFGIRYGKFVGYDELTDLLGDRYIQIKYPWSSPDYIDLLSNSNYGYSWYKSKFNKEHFFRPELFELVFTGYIKNPNNTLSHKYELNRFIETNKFDSELITKLTFVINHIKSYFDSMHGGESHLRHISIKIISGAEMPYVLELKNIINEVIDKQGYSGVVVLG